MGQTVQFVAGHGPQLASPLRSKADIDCLQVADAAALDYVMQAISLTKRELAGKVPLFGFAGSPWTVACYMIEGAGSKMWQAVRTMLYQDPASLHRLLDKITRTTVHYLNAQIEAGADAIMLFDTWGGVLSYAAYPEFSLRYMQRVAESVHRHYRGRAVPLVFFTKNATPWLDQIANSGCDAIGLDSTVNLQHAHALIGQRAAIQGNLDPQVLFADSEKISAEVEAILDLMNGSVGHVFNLGHGIDKDTPIAGVEHMMTAIRRYDSQRGDG